jgi:hypothetical protein
MKRLTFLLLFFNSLLNAQDTSKIINEAVVGVNAAFSFKMLEPTQDLRKIDILLQERKVGSIKERGLVIGTSLIAIGDYQKSNTNSKFAYLMRHPTSANEIGNEVSEAVIHSFQLSLTGAVNSWLTVHAEMLYNPEQSFGAGTITTLARNQLQLRTGYIVFGNLNKLPLYLAIGKMDGPFGQTGSVSPFSNSSTWHAFGTLGYGAQFGFKKWGLNITGMAVQGGAQFRSLNTPVGDSTNVPSQLNNYIGDINYTLKLGKKSGFTVGGSYLYGSAYCQDFPITHFSPSKENNPAYSYYAKLVIANKLTLKGSYAQTEKVWKGTHNPHAPLNVFSASKVSSLDAGIKFEFNVKGKVIYALSGEFSKFNAGAPNSPWERQNQLLFGFSATLKQSAKLFIEAFRTDGYDPLNFISGSATNAPFPDGITPSVRDAFSHGVVLGGIISF